MSAFETPFRIELTEMLQQLVGELPFLRETQREQTPVLRGCLGWRLRRSSGGCGHEAVRLSSMTPFYGLAGHYCFGQRLRCIRLQVVAAFDLDQFRVPEEFDVLLCAGGWDDRVSRSSDDLGFDVYVSQ